MAHAPHVKLNHGAQAGLDKATGHLPALTRAYARALRAGGRRAAARFRQTEAVTAAAQPQTPAWIVPPAQTLIDQGQLAVDVNRKTGKLHRLILTASAGEALKPFGINFDIHAPTSKLILDQYSKRITETVGSAIAEQVTEAIQSGYATGQSVAQVSAAIQKSTDAISSVRADMLARSDLNGIANAGSLLAAQTSGAAKSKSWLAVIDDRTRPDHVDADGQTVGLGDQFVVGGETCNAPGDPSLSWEQSANCRCTLVYGTAPLMASGPRQATPRDFAEWRDYTWEGASESGKQPESKFGAAPSEITAASDSPGVLYVARHGLTEYDTEDHAKDTIRGWADDPLNDAGVAEAGRLAGNLVGLGITSITCSDLQRADKTATIVGQRLEEPPKATMNLRPWNLGDLQGRTSDEARDDIVRYVDNPDEAVPGGESFNDFCSRFLPVVADAMAAAENGASPLLVTHSHNLKLARAWIQGGRAPVTGAQFMEPCPGPASVLAVDPDGWQVTEILCGGEPLDESGHVPPEVHYRPATATGMECGTCEFYAAGRCSMFDATVLADYVCDEFVAKSSATAVTSGGEMTGTTWHLDTRDGTAEIVDVFAASGDTGLPLSERDRAWDAPDATKRVAKWASSDGSGDKDKVDWGKYGKAFFAGSGTDFGGYKLPFADIIGGKLTAVWRGVTAAAARLNQTQGVDKAAVQGKIAGYYAAARKAYGDDSIQVPWAKKGASADGETLAAIHAYLADFGADGVLDDDDLRAHVLVDEFLRSRTATLKHQYAGAGKTCAVCGEPHSDAAHYAAEGDALLAAVTAGTPWTATLCVAGEPTVDSGIKRVLDPGGGSWLPLPLPLALLDDSPHADVTTKAPVVGRIDQIWMAGDVCQASGIFFDQSDDAKLAEMGSKAAALVDGMRRMGISVDLVDIEVEMCAWGDAGEIDMDAANDPTARNYDDKVDPNSPGGPATETGLPNDIPEMDDESNAEEPDMVFLFRQWVIGGATICPVQALTQATISLVASGEPEVLTAAAAGLAPLEPPADWFEDPQLDGPTPLTVTDDGRVYGHLAAWGVCHTGKPGVCVTAPSSPSGYRNFHRGQVKTQEGGRVDVGVLTMNTGHAGLRMSATATVAHYDDTGTQAAHVRAGEDEYGIWLAGAINPKLSAEDARILMASPPSGDWREVNRGEGLDLFAALAVNGPGFPVPRARLVASGAELERVALVAAGMVEPAEVDDAAFARELAILAASADGIAGLAALVEA